MPEERRSVVAVGRHPLRRPAPRGVDQLPARRPRPSLERIEQAFHRRHEELYGFASPGKPMEIDQPPRDGARPAAAASRSSRRGGDGGEAPRRGRQAHVSALDAARSRRSRCSTATAWRRATASSGPGARRHAHHDDRRARDASTSPSTPRAASSCTRRRPHDDDPILTSVHREPPEGDRRAHGRRRRAQRPLAAARRGPRLLARDLRRRRRAARADRVHPGARLRDRARDARDRERVPRQTSQEGDVVLHNDPFTGGNQLSDWKVAKPVFHEGEHFGWVVIAAHQADVGGAVPGSYNPNATDLWQEGLRITPLKLYEGGKRRDDVWDFVFGNVRLDVVADDVSAMIGSCTVGERELKALLARYGTETVRAATRGLLDAAEQARARGDRADPRRRLPRRVVRPRRRDRPRPRGDDPRRGHDRRARGSASTSASTDPQVTGYVNAPLAVTISSVMIAFFMIADEELPHNDGIMRCIEVVAPEGCLVNPRYPAPTGFGNHLSDQIAAVIMLALAPAVPRQVTACWNHLLATIVAGWSTARRRAVRRHPDQRLQGRRRRHLRRRRLRPHRPDHLGRRDRRAGPGDVRARQPAPPAPLRVPARLGRRGAVARRARRRDRASRSRTAASRRACSATAARPRPRRSASSAAAAAAPTRSSSATRTARSTGRTSRTSSPGSRAGTVYRQVAGGGGGYGDPHERPVERVLEEARNGVISLESALRDYGVAIDPETWTGQVDRPARDCLKRSIRTLRTSTAPVITFW